MVKEKRVPLNVVIAPGTKAFIDRERGKRSQGVFVDEMVEALRSGGGTPNAAVSVVAAEPVNRMPASPYAETRLRQLSAEWNLEPRMMLDLVFEIFGQVSGSGQAGEALASPAADPLTVPPSPAGLQTGEVPCRCEHCGNDFTAGRRMTLCVECFRGGHRGDVRDCGSCGTGFAL